MVLSMFSKQALNISLALMALCIITPHIHSAEQKSALQTEQKIVVRSRHAVPFEGSKLNTAPGFLAMVRGDSENDLSFKQGGILEIIGNTPGKDWQEGVNVKKGDMLARLVQADFLNTLASAQAQADLQRKSYDRNKALFDNNTISRQELDASEAARKSADAALAQAKQALADSVMRPPFNGTILARLKNSGETIAAGETVLRFADLTTMSIELGVPDEIVSQLKPGQQIPIVISALEGRVFTGKIDEVGVAAKKGTRLFKVVIKAPNPEGVIKSGMTASVTLDQKMHVNPASVLIPLSALVTSTKPDTSGQLAVFVVNNGHASERLVKTDDIIGSSIIVTDGLKAGDEAVVAGATTLYDNAPVDARPSEETQIMK